MWTAGIIANPAAGKDIRRLVAHGRFVPDQEKVNVIRRVLTGLEAAGVERVVMMPDSAMLGKAAVDGMSLGIDVQLLEMPVYAEERDSTRAAGMMAEMGVGCVVTLGGDGTNRAVAKGSGSVPLVPISTGTNNVFSTAVEGTLAGLAAGVVARGLVDAEGVVSSTLMLEVQIGEGQRDIALIDVAVSKELSVGARAIWDVETLHEVFLARVEPASIGLSAIGARLSPAPVDSSAGLHIGIGRGGSSVMAPVAPGTVSEVPVRCWSQTRVGERIEVGLSPCTIALDGERTYRLAAGQRAQVTLSDQGPPVVSVEAALRQACLSGVFAGGRRAAADTIGPPRLG